MLRTIIPNFVVECILHAKTLQLYLTGMGRWRDPRESQEVTIAIASARWEEFEADPSHSTKPNRSHLDRFRQHGRRLTMMLLWRKRTMNVDSEKLYIYSDGRHTHTHTLPQAGGWLRSGQMRWKWGVSYLTWTRRGEHKRRRKRANTNTNTPGPERANPERARKEKRRPTETSPYQRRREKTEAPKPTNHSET